MTLAQVMGIYRELREKYEAKLSEFKVKTDSEIYFENENLDKVEELSERGYASLDINVFSDNIDKESALCFCASVSVTNDRVDDDEILGETEAFEASLNEFIGALALSEDPETVIRTAIEDSDRSVEEMMRDFERRIKKTNTAAIIAVGVCVVAAAVALIVNFLL